MMQIVFRNLFWKLFSLAVAVGLWLTFVSSPQEATSVAAPIEFRNIPPDLEMVTDTIDRVHLEIQGPAARLQNYDLSRTLVVFDVGGVHRPGERTFTIRESDVKLPPGLHLIRAVPAQIRVQFEQRDRKTVPVKVRFSHQPPKGYRIARQEVDPPRVEIIGPESRVDTVDGAETDPIDLSNVVANAEFHVSVYINDPQVRLVSSPTVHVRVFLQKSGQ